MDKISSNNEFSTKFIEETVSKLNVDKDDLNVMLSMTNAAKKNTAPGVDRLVMLLTGEESIREVITFPMNKNAQDLMMDAPTTVSQKQLDDVHILINEAHLQ